MDAPARPADHRAMDTQTLLAIAAIFAAAGLVKGISGMGLPTLSMALLSLTTLPPAGAAALMVLPSLLTNIAQCLGSHWRTLARQLWPMWLGLVLATLSSPLPALGAGNSRAHALMGGLLVVYGLWGLVKPALPNPGRFARPWGALAGLASGVLTASTGVFVMPMVPFLQSLRLEKAAMLQAMGLSFTLATLALAARLGHGSGAYFSGTQLLGSGLALTAALIGMWGGTRLLGRLPAAVFQRILYGVFLALGGLMLAH